MNLASWGWRGGDWGPSQVRLLFWPLPEPQVRLWSSGKAMVWPVLEVSQEGLWLGLSRAGPVSPSS